MTDILTKPNLEAEKLVLAGQRRRFIEAAKASGAGEDEVEFDAMQKRVVKPASVP